MADDWMYGAEIESEMSRLVRQYDWANTSLGPISTWPMCLKYAVSTALTSHFSIVLWLGPDYRILYNSSFSASCGNKHPSKFGLPGGQFWDEMWPILHPMLESVKATKRATWRHDQQLMSTRHNYIEETYWTYSYSPILSPDGTVHGIFTATQDNTDRVVSERRLKSLHEISLGLSDVEGTSQTCDLVAKGLSRNPHDIPFAILYLSHTSPFGRKLVIERAAGIDHSKLGVTFPKEEPIGRASADNISAIDSTDTTPVASAALLALCLKRNSIVIATLSAKDQAAMGNLPPWDDTPRQVAYLPLGVRSSAPGRSERADLGVLVVGINTHRAVDDAYSTFLSLLSSQVGSALGTASGYEQEKQRAQKLAELDQAKTVFFSNISHEFRTPLTLMLGPLEDLLFSSANLSRLSETERGALQLVHRNGLRLLKLVNVLLDFSRIEAGRMQARYRPVDLSALTQDLASVFRGACEKAGLRLKVECSAPLPRIVYVDVDMWEKIVLNLLSNAYKYTLEGEIDVIVRESNGAAELLVRDTGCGIPEAEMPRLFERFHRVQATQGRTHEGTGIGLALVSELVRLHGGTIRAESSQTPPNRGTKFSVTIPFGAEHLPREHILTLDQVEKSLPSPDAMRGRSIDWWVSPSTSVAASPPAVGMPSMMGDLLSTSTGGVWTSNKEGSASSEMNATRQLVMVVDDNSDMLGYVSRILSDAGLEVIQASDGLQALQILNESTRKPDLVVSDIMMPRLDGLGLLSAMRASPTSELAAIPVIFLSARAGEEARSEGIMAGADDYLAKPFSARELLIRVMSRIELSRLRSAAAKREQQLRCEAERANAVKDRFLAVLSHELRTPLTPALLVTDEAQHDPSLPAALREDLAMVTRQIRLQVQLIDDLLDITKIRQGKLQLHMQYVDMSLVLRHTVTLFERSTHEKGITVSLDMKAEHASVHGDPTRLQQILWNVIGNAVKFTPSGGRITIRAYNGNASVGTLSTVTKRSLPSMLYVSIQDTGIGIDPVVLPRLFTAFEQGDTSVGRQFGGLGLGLNISQTLAKMHLGTLTAQSEGKDKGSTFTLALPVSDPNAGQELTEHRRSGTVAIAGPLMASKRPKGASLSILLVDDDETTLMILARLLGSKHTIHTAKSLGEARSLASSMTPNTLDLLICDMGLPDGYGADLLEQLRRSGQAKLQGIGLTGYGREEDIQRTLSAGFSVHLVKPISRAEVENAILKVFALLL